LLLQWARFKTVRIFFFLFQTSGLVTSQKILCPCKTGDLYGDRKPQREAKLEQKVPKLRALRPYTWSPTSHSSDLCRLQS
jgi:hypothetical protein